MAATLVRAQLAALSFRRVCSQIADLPLMQRAASPSVANPIRYASGHRRADFQRLVTADEFVILRDRACVIFDFL